MDTPYTSDEEDELENRVIQPDAQAEQYDYTKDKDLSGVFICQICDRLIEPDQPKTELMCHHTFHTYCCFHYILFHYNLDRGPMTCTTCGTNIYRELYQDNNENRNLHNHFQEKKRIKKEAKLKKFEEEVMADKGLLADLKIVKRSITEAKKACTAYTRIEKAHAREFHTESDNLRKILQSLKDDRMKRIKSSEEAKVWRSKRARAAFFIRAFERKYPDYSLPSLHTIKRLKIPNRWQLNRILYTGFGRRLYWRLRIRI
jgi:hypothetical protein